MDIDYGDGHSNDGRHSRSQVRDTHFSSDEESPHRRDDVNDHDTGGDKNNSDKNDSKKSAKKKTGPVKRLLLNEDMLCGKNGIIKLQNIFLDFNSKGGSMKRQISTECSTNMSTGCM